MLDVAYQQKNTATTTTMPAASPYLPPFDNPGHVQSIPGADTLGWVLPVTIGPEVAGVVEVGVAPGTVGAGAAVGIGRIVKLGRTVGAREGCPF